MSVLTDLCKRLEHFETPEWAVRAILNKEIMTRVVVDPCVGSGVLARAAKDMGYTTLSYDINDWGFEGTIVDDFLLLSLDNCPDQDIPFSVLMNPPFSRAVEFVEQAFLLGARKVVCFQRFAWWESHKRKGFWDKFPPNRVYICGDRADCWRHDIPADQRGSSSPTAHAWFVWERGNPPGTILGRIHKGDAC